MNIIRCLNQLGKEVNSEFENINYGGCAIFASLVGKRLEELGVGVSGITTGSCPWQPKISVDQARAKITHPGRKMQWIANGINFFHVGLCFKHNGKKYHYDSNGAHRPEKTLGGAVIFDGVLFLSEVIAIAREHAGWNKSFNRRSVPAIRRLVYDHLPE